MWVIEEETGIDISVLSFPVGYPFLNVMAGAKFHLRSPSQRQIETNSYLAGPYATPFHLSMPLVKRALTVQLAPYAIPFVLGLPSSELSNEVWPIAELNASLARQLEELIESDVSSEDVLRASEHLLAQHYHQPMVQNSRVAGVCRAVIASKGEISVKSLAEGINLSTRRLQQLFKAQIGLCPKVYSRIIKMQYHTFQLLNGTAIDTIVPDGYYDQSHFIHELKRQTGMLPGQFQAYITDPALRQAYLASNIYSNLD